MGVEYSLRRDVDSIVYFRICIIFLVIYKRLFHLSNIMSKSPMTYGREPRNILNDKLGELVEHCIHYGSRGKMSVL